MYIEFVKSSDGNYGGYYVPINLMGNGIVFGAAGCGSALVVALALKALGYSKAAIALGSTFAIAVGTASFVTVAIGAIFMAVIGTFRLAGQ